MTRRIWLATALFVASAGLSAAADMPPGHVEGMDHAAHMCGSTASADSPREVGQSAFAAIQEIVDRLAADPATDWSRVDIAALRAHLIDMDNVTLAAEVKTEGVDGGVRFVATASGPAVGSIRRMIAAHAAAMNGADGWTLLAEEVADGAALTVTAASADEVAKIAALGLIGVLALGMHHQDHHLAIARGDAMHH